jgi:hydrogenase maturation protease
MSRRILVAGIGNIFFGDDAFGVEVVRELLREPMPEGVRVEDFGIRSYDLAYALMDGYEEVILIDATSRGEAPGTVYLLEPKLGGETEMESVDGHSINAMSVLRMAKSLGGPPVRVHLVGCEPEILETEQIGLSVRVQLAVPTALQLVKQLLEDLIGSNAVGERPANLR